MFNAFLPRAPLWLHSTSPSPCGIHICFPRSGTLGRPCWQTLDVWAEVVGLDSFSSQGPRVMSSGLHSQVEGMGESWHRKKRVSLPLLVFLPHFFLEGCLMISVSTLSPPFHPLHRLRDNVMWAVFYPLGEAHLWVVSSKLGLPQVQEPKLLISEERLLAGTQLSVPGVYPGGKYPTDQSEFDSGHKVELSTYCKHGMLEVKLVQGWW